jgi:hypothetical protein
METRRQEILDFYNELKEDEVKFGKKFSAKYGAGSINIETGEFTPEQTTEIGTEKASF